MSFLLLSEGRRCLRGHRMQLYVIQLWIILCWLIPVATELALRRVLPSTDRWQGVYLVGGFLFNRLLLAPAHRGYYAFCYRLATIGCGDAAATCEIGNVYGQSTTTVLRDFFREYRHPLRALKWQLRWDVLRAGGYLAVLFPGICLLVYGGIQSDALLSTICGGCGVLLSAAVAVPMGALLCRLNAARYLDVDIPLSQAFARTRNKTGELLRCRLRALWLLPFIRCPLSRWRTALHIEIAAVLLARPHRREPVRTSQIFHTRVLGQP